MIYINAHSLYSLSTDRVELEKWFRNLYILLSFFGLHKDNIYVTFDDFYIDENKLLESLISLGIKNIYIFYSPNLLSVDDMSSYISINSSKPIKPGNKKNLLSIKSKYPFIKIGVHGMSHENYSNVTLEESVNLFEKQIEYHKHNFDEECLYFAFPYGRAPDEIINRASEYFHFTFLSDNRYKITTYVEQDKFGGIINRRHLEIGGNLIKLFILLLREKLK
ncbi:predicted deacetylase [Psychromonas ingrahamii 37]|uniref:Predicted deacetylase n=1 Tax=Psychromonas ingrahamii (strain DSM 17664 / CCUG 51855 / 37) TaxID=357804 RepID=A1ST14_PSYIN|nr:predicted deacetylase [Psychromonas ingrahamii 37]